MNIKYVIKKLKNMRYKEYFNHAKIVGKKINKSTIYILYDMAKCAILYGSGYMDYFEFEFYLLNKDERTTYLTGKINNDIIRKYNRKEDWILFNDKGKFNIIFRPYLGRKFIDLRDASYKDFKDFILDKNLIVSKNPFGSGGKGVSIIKIDKDKLKNDYNILKIYNSIMKKEGYVVEEFITQHPLLSKLYDKCVNSIRVISFLDDDYNTHILNVILRIGNNGNVDNFSSGGMYTFVNEDGVVYTPAIDEKGNIFYKHPESNEDIVGFKIPLFDKIKPFIEEISTKVSSIRYVGWDIVITSDGIKLIEGNEYPGIFEVKPSLSLNKRGSLPEYRKYMDI